MESPQCPGHPPRERRAFHKTGQRLSLHRGVPLLLMHIMGKARRSNCDPRDLVSFRAPGVHGISHAHNLGVNACACALRKSKTIKAPQISGEKAAGVIMPTRPASCGTGMVSLASSTSLAMNIIVHCYGCCNFHCSYYHICRHHCHAYTCACPSVIRLLKLIVRSRSRYRQSCYQTCQCWNLQLLPVVFSANQ